MGKRFDKLPNEKKEFLDLEKARIVVETNSDLRQCPKCKQLFNIKYTDSHQCERKGWFCCSICGISLEKAKKKKRILNGVWYWEFLPSKVYFRLVDSLICFNCVFKLVKMFKTYEKPKKK